VTGGWFLVLVPGFWLKPRTRNQEPETLILSSSSVDLTTSSFLAIVRVVRDAGSGSKLYPQGVVLKVLGRFFEERISTPHLLN
jgi:hypothetical protein